MLDEEENRREDHDALVAAGVPVHVLAVRDVADLDAQLPALAAEVGATWVPLRVSAPRAGVRCRAVVPIWRRPWMTLGPETYGGSLLRSLGVEVHPAGLGRYPVVELDGLRAEAPDVVLVPSEPYAFKEAHLAELRALAPTVRVDGQDLLWWGARTVGAMQRLGSQLSSILS